MIHTLLEIIIEETVFPCLARLREYAFSIRRALNSDSEMSDSFFVPDGPELRLLVRPVEGGREGGALPRPAERLVTPSRPPRPPRVAGNLERCLGYGITSSSDSVSSSRI